MPYHVPVYNFKVEEGFRFPSLDIVFDSSIKHLIDGKRYIQQISKESNVDINAVKMLITHLVYYNVVSIVDIFTFENRYKCSPNIKDFISDVSM